MEASPADRVFSMTATCSLPNSSGGKLLFLQMTYSSAWHALLEENGLVRRRNVLAVFVLDHMVMVGRVFLRKKLEKKSAPLYFFPLPHESRKRTVLACAAAFLSARSLAQIGDNLSCAFSFLEVVLDCYRGSDDLEKIFFFLTYRRFLKSLSV